MSQTRTFELEKPFIRGLAVFQIGRRARGAGSIYEFSDRDTRLRITLTHNGGQLQDFWSSRAKCVQAGANFQINSLLSEEFCDS